MQKLIGLVLLCATLARAADVVCNETIFKCIPERPNNTIIIIGDDMQFEAICPEDQVCNTHYKLSVLNKCDPCIIPSTDCDGLFDCPEGATSIVSIDGFQLQCPEKTVCNVEFKAPCELCVRDSCPDEEVYTCPPEKPEYFIMENELIRCRPGYSCNSDYFPPCEKCIEKTKQAALRAARQRNL